MRERLRPEYAIAVVYVASMFMNALDTTVVNVALPTLRREFDAQTGVEWLVTGYLLSLAAWIPASGWIGDRFGNKATFLTAMAIFTIARAACGAAQTLEQAVALRIIQGIGGGMMIPVGFAMLMRAFPPEKRAQVARILIVPSVIGPASGPVIGGLLIDTLSWRWVFLVTLPLGIATFIFGWVFLREHKEPRPGAFDLPGFVLSAGGLALLLFSLSSGPQRGWSSPISWGSGIAGLVAFTLLVVVELQRAEPMLNFRLIKDRLFRTAMLAGTFSTGAFLGILFLMPQFLQQVRGVSALQSGLATFPEAVGVLCGSQIAGRLYLTVGPRRLMASGLGAVTFWLFLIAGVDTETNLWVVRVLMFCVGASMSFVFLPMQACVFARMKPADMGNASAIYNAQRQVAAALGVAVLATVLALRFPGANEGLPSAEFVSRQVGAFRDVFLLAAAFALAGAVLSLFIRDSDAAATMRPRQAVVKEAAAAAD